MMKFEGGTSTQEGDEIPDSPQVRLPSPTAPDDLSKTRVNGRAPQAFSPSPSVQNMAHDIETDEPIMSSTNADGAQGIHLDQQGGICGRIDVQEIHNDGPENTVLNIEMRHVFIRGVCEVTCVEEHTKKTAFEYRPHTNGFPLWVVAMGVYYGDAWDRDSVVILVLGLEDAYGTEFVEVLYVCTVDWITLIVYSHELFVERDLGMMLSESRIRISRPAQRALLFSRKRVILIDWYRGRNAIISTHRLSLSIANAELSRNDSDLLLLVRNEEYDAESYSTIVSSFMAIISIAWIWEEAQKSWQHAFELDNVPRTWMPIGSSILYNDQMHTHHQTHVVQQAKD